MRVPSSERFLCVGYLERCPLIRVTLTHPYQPVLKLLVLVSAPDPVELVYICIGLLAAAGRLRGPADQAKLKYSVIPLLAHYVEIYRALKLATPLQNSFQHPHWSGK